MHTVFLHREQTTVIVVMSKDVAFFPAGLLLNLNFWRSSLMLLCIYKLHFYRRYRAWSSSISLKLHSDQTRAGFPHNWFQWVYDVLKRVMLLGNAAQGPVSLKKGLPNKPGLFQLVWHILNQISWQEVRLTEISLAYLVNLFYETGFKSSLENDLCFCIHMRIKFAELHICRSKRRLTENSWVLSTPKLCSLQYLSTLHFSINSLSFVCIWMCKSRNVSACEEGLHFAVTNFKVRVRQIWTCDQ